MDWQPNTFMSPAARALTELTHDVKEAQEAIAEVLDDEKALAAICLSEKDAFRAVQEGRQVPSMRLAAALLGSYERQIQSVEGALRVRPLAQSAQGAKRCLSDPERGWMLL